MKILLLTILFLIFYTFPILAHPGNTSPDGCHYCRTNCAKWGEIQGARHCHNAKINYTPPSYNTNRDYTKPFTTTSPLSTAPNTTNEDNSWLYLLLVIGGAWLFSKFSTKSE